MSDSWISARRPRQAVQMRLAGKEYAKIVTPRTTSRAPLKDVTNTSHGSPLTAFGFTKQSTAMSRKRRFAHLQMDEVKDSQADSDDENYSLLPDSSPPLQHLSSPVKRQKQQHELSRHEDMANNACPSTPRFSRFIEHDSSSPPQEVPSSVSWEREAYAPWCEETPIKAQRYRMLPLSMGIHSPPQSSPIVRHDFDANQNNAQHQLPFGQQATPVAGQSQIFTPPATVEGIKLFQEYGVPMTSIHDQSGFLAASKACAEHNVHNGKRAPLVELNPALILAPESRQNSQRLHAGLSQTRITREATSVSRDESPTEWYDALESLSQQSSRSDVRNDIVPPPINDNSVQDSQFDDTFAPLSSDPSLPNFDFTGHAASESSIASWQNTNSLNHTLLPPNWHFPQHFSDVASEALSDRYDQDLSSTQDQQSPLLQKRAYQEIAEEDSFSRKRVALPSSEPWSIDYDQSLANTMLPPPIFSLLSSME